MLYIINLKPIGIHLSNSTSISAILDPHYKITTFNNLEERNNCINHLQNLFSSYTVGHKRNAKLLT